MSEQILDLAEFLERIQNDKKLLWELLDIFIDDFRLKAGPLRAAVAGNNSDQIRRLAHALKGSAANISAHQLHAVLAVLEKKGKDNDLTGAAELLEDLNKKFEVFVNHVWQLKDDLK